MALSNVWVPPLAWVTQTGSWISCAFHWRTTLPNNMQLAVILLDAGQFGHVQIFACRKVGLTFAQRRKLGRRPCMWSRESTFSFKNVTDSGSEGGAVVLSRLSGSDATHPKYIVMMLDHFDMGLNISNCGKVVRKTPLHVIEWVNIFTSCWRWRWCCRWR